MVKSSFHQGYLFKQLFAILSMLLLLLLYVPTILSQKILIEKLDCNKQDNSGTVVYEKMSENISVNGLAVFGWIRINSTAETGDIFQVYSEHSPPYPYSMNRENKLEDLLFST